MFQPIYVNGWFASKLILALLNVIPSLAWKKFGKGDRGTIPIQS